MKELYCGMDLHSSNTYIGILDVNQKRVFKKRLRNDLSLIVGTLEPYRNNIRGVVVESTYNWYWLVDGLMGAGYKVHLANPAGMVQYSGLKYSDDKHSAFWLAQLLQLGILPEGYIYPRAERPVRDLLRKRSFLVKHRTSFILSLQSMIQRNTGAKPVLNELKKMDEEEINDLFEDEYLRTPAMSNLSNMHHLIEQISLIEKKIKGKIKLRKPFVLLNTIPGVGDIISMTIMLEIGDHGRFHKVGDFCSYCRCAPSTRISNKKKIGKGNARNGNKYLAWAISEAAYFATIHSERIKKYRQRKQQQTNVNIAAKAVCNKLARAIFYMLKNEVPFQEDAIFCGKWMGR
jgi:transposase